MQQKGRPNLDGDARGHSPTITVRLTRDLQARLAERSVRERISQSALIRRALALFLDQDAKGSR